MIAAVFQGPGLGHRIERVPDPAPGPGEVVVEVERSGICGSDISLTNERESPGLLAAFETAFRPGSVLGHEFCGTVVAVDDGVANLRIGDRIAPMFFYGCAACAACLTGAPQRCDQVGWTMGGNAEYARAHSRFCVVIPPEVSAEQGAWVEPLATSLRIAQVSGIGAGDRVLVIGAGALGLGVALFARRLGATRVAAAARTPAKADAARQVGVDHFLTSTGAELAADASDALGGPPDVVVETAGAIGLVDTAILCARPGGTIAVAGLCLDPESTSHAIASLKDLCIRYTAAYTMREFAVVVDMLRGGSAPQFEITTRTTGFDGFPAAFDSLRGGGAPSKIQLNPRWG